MSVSAERKQHIRQVVVHETQDFVATSAFLAAFFLALTLYRTLLLSEYETAPVQYGYAILEALILGKVILIGDAIGIGKRFHDRPLIVSSLWKTLTFGIFVAFFSLLEHFIEGLFRHEPLSTVLPSLAGQRGLELLARVIVTLVAFVPLFAFRETGRVLGEGKLFELFFRRRVSGTDGAGPTPPHPA